MRPRTFVTGPVKAVVKALMWGEVGLIALKRRRGPLSAWRLVREVSDERARRRGGRLTAKYAQANGRFFWDMYAPGWPSRAFVRYVEGELARVDGIRPLQTAIVAITKRCPLRCEHCCEWASLNRPEALSMDELVTLARDLVGQGISQLFLSGGEPLQRFSAVLGVTAAARGDADVWLLTSGAGLTADRGRQLAEVGLTGVAVSLDHWRPEVHDRFRGRPGAFSDAVAAARRAREAGLLLALSLCPGREFALPEDLDLYVDLGRDLGAAFIQVFEPRAVGRYAGLDVALDDAARGFLRDATARLTFDRPDAPALHDLAGVRRADRCHGAGDRYLYVDTDGLAHPCPFCRQAAGRAVGGLADALERLRGQGCPCEDQGCVTRPGATPGAAMGG